MRLIVINRHDVEEMITELFMGDISISIAILH